MKRKEISSLSSLFSLSLFLFLHLTTDLWIQAGYLERPWFNQPAAVSNYPLTSSIQWKPLYNTVAYTLAVI